MVLQNTRATNLAKDENAPPTASPRPKGLVSRIYEDASSRGRTRSSGTSTTSKYRVEQAKRRKARARGSVRLNVPTLPTAADVEMSNATSSSSLPRTQAITLQRELLRPQYKEVSLEYLRDVEPAVEELSLKTIRSGLEAHSSHLVRALHDIKVDPMKDQLPKEMLVHAPENGDCLPTHMLAVFSPPPANGETSSAIRKVTLFPVHSLVLLAHCANICQPPPAIAPPMVGETEVMLPVWRMWLPAPAFYPQLSTYLYTKQVGYLLRTFLPCPPPRDLMTNPIRVQGYALYLSQTFTMSAMLKHIYSLDGLWKNVCHLGVYDDNLWAAMDVMWKTLLTALAIASGNPSIMFPHPNPSSSSSSSRPPTTSPMNESP